MAEYQIVDSGGLELLAQACAALDRAEALRERIDVDGEIIEGASGLRDHPGLKHELASRICDAMHRQARTGRGAHPARRAARYAGLQRMTTKRTPIARAGLQRITPEAVSAYRTAKQHVATYTACVAGEACKSSDPGRHCAECRIFLDECDRLNELLGLRPWEASPLDVDHPEQESPWPEGSGGAQSWPQALQLRAELDESQSYDAASVCFWVESGR